MPRMSGYEACERIKSNELTKNIPVVFLSAKGQENEIQTGLEIGAQEYILKPFSPEDLIKRINQILANKSESDQALT
jgi:DNA-binding response OmpR family regulator